MVNSRRLRQQTSAALTLLLGSIAVTGITGCNAVPGTSNALREVPSQPAATANVQNNPNIPEGQRQAMMAAQERQAGQKTVGAPAGPPPQR